jgi:glycosyltransferase involved in cell wall biosynthesis
VTVPDAVVFVVVRSHVREVYGGEKSTIASAAGLAARGVRASFVTTARDDFARELEEAGLEYEVVPVGDPFTGFRGAGLFARARRLAGIARVNAAVFRAARRRRAVVHTVAVPGFLCGFAGGLLARAPVVFHVRSAPGGLRANGLEQLGMLLARRTVAVSRSLRDRLVSTGRPALRPLFAGRVLAIENGFDFGAIDAFLAREPRPERGGARVEALCVGGIWRRKGQLALLDEVLPRAVAEEPRLHVTLAGGASDEAYHRACVEAVRRHHLEAHVTFAGYLPREEVYRRYLAADLLVVPSEGEGLPRCAIEAQAFGLPVVATATVGNVDAVRDGETGYLVPLAAMAGRIVALARDAPLRARLGAAGARHVRATFDLSRNIEAIRALYHGLA